jgi:hypothetical protein
MGNAVILDSFLNNLGMIATALNDWWDFRFAMGISGDLNQCLD